MTQEVLKLALDALERLRPEGFFNEAITAIKEALREHAMREVQRLGQEIEQEPVAWMDADGNVSDNNDHKCFPIPLYTLPPQRTWVGLTEEDVNGFVGQYWGDEYMKMRSMVRAIEAKLKQKNMENT
jgi:hypothetical protein